eukprot:2043490-Amphidinium_carterae.1
MHYSANAAHKLRHRDCTTQVAAQRLHYTSCSTEIALHKLQHTSCTIDCTQRTSCSTQEALLSLHAAQVAASKMHY